MVLTQSGTRVVEARFLRRNESGEVTESPSQMCERVAKHVAQGERANLANDPLTTKLWTERFQTALESLDFLPNSPTLANAGTAIKQLSACFVLPVQDSMEAIFDALKLMAIIQQSGGGTGFSFSHLRPQGDRVSRTGGSASGPLSFMKIFDVATENIRQGGRRRGANMGILRVDHPDIEAFIAAKRDGVSYRNFNLSVGITDEFMKQVESEGEFALRDPHTKAERRSVKALGLWRQIAECAWETGDPGLVFLDSINRLQPTPELGVIEATNPCGEVPLLPFEACTLGSINLSHLSQSGKIDWKKLESLVELGVRFLDDVVEMSEWPDPAIHRVVRGNRKIGLGVMGFAECLIQLGIPYGSAEAGKTAESLMKFINEKAFGFSQVLAEERGVFPNWEKSIYKKQNVKLRNATRTSIAPTGTIGIVAGTSAGIEPLFALAYRRHALDGQLLLETNPLFIKHLEKTADKGKKILESLARTGKLPAHSADLSAQTRELFRTALELTPEEHLKVQESFQKHTDNAVSKTINLPGNATSQSIQEVYLQAWRRGLKGTTVFRYGSKSAQVLELGTEESSEEKEFYFRCDPNDCRL